jgi:hypothetical protein
MLLPAGRIVAILKEYTADIKGSLRHRGAGRPPRDQTTRGPYALIAAVRDHEHRQPVEYRPRACSMAAVRDDERRVLNPLIVRSARNEPNVLGRVQHSRLDRGAERHERGHGERRERVYDPLKNPDVILKSRAETDEHERSLVIGGPVRNPLLGPNGIVELWANVRVSGWIRCGPEVEGATDRDERKPRCPELIEQRCEGRKTDPSPARRSATAGAFDGE